MIRRRIELTDADIETVQDAARVLSELHAVRPHDMTSRSYAMQYDNLLIVIEDLMGILRRE